MASSGSVRTAHMPATTAKAVAINTSIRFLADQPMSRAIIGWPSVVAGAVKPFSAACRLLSASMRKLPLTTTLSPSATPLTTSTKPSPRRPALISRGSKRPSPRSSKTTCRLPLSMTALEGTAMTSSVGARRDLDVAIHVRQQREVGVRQLDAHAHGAGFFHQMRIDDR